MTYTVYQSITGIRNTDLARTDSLADAILVAQAMSVAYPSVTFTVGGNLVGIVSRFRAGDILDCRELHSVTVTCKDCEVPA